MVDQEFLLISFRKQEEFNLLKVNYGSDLRKAFVSTFGRAYEANHNACSVIELSIEAVENVSEKQLN